MCEGMTIVHRRRGGKDEGSRTFTERRTPRYTTQWEEMPLVRA